MTQAVLYVVATPLGNRSDITLRAIEILKQVARVFAEDTREASKLMELCGISMEGKKVFSYASHNLKKSTALAVEILQEGQNIALVTDRGTPGISDPGALLVAAAREAGFAVIPVPGPSAVAALVSVSGLTDAEFLFAGFVPREEKKCQLLFEKISQGGFATCFYESPRRIRETFLRLQKAFPKGRLLYGREMTKHFEEYVWLDLQASEVELPELGEYVLLLLPGEVEKKVPWLEEVRLRLASDRDWSKAVAARYGIASKEVYNALHHGSSIKP